MAPVRFGETQRELDPPHFVGIPPTLSASSFGRAAQSRSDARFRRRDTCATPRAISVESFHPDAHTRWRALDRNENHAGNLLAGRASLLVEPHVQGLPKKSCTLCPPRRNTRHQGFRQPRYPGRRTGSSWPGIDPTKARVSIERQPLPDGRNS
jgi:hypothetical protein